MNEMQLLGNLVRETRERRGMEAQQLAAVMGVSKGTVSNIERGVIKTTPDADFLKRLSSAVGLSMPQILETLGYLDSEDSGHSKESQAIAAVRPILESQEFTDGQIRALVMSVQNTVDMLKGKY